LIVASVVPSWWASDRARSTAVGRTASGVGGDVGDARLDRLDAAVAAGGEHRLAGGGHRQALAQQGGHARRERQAQVHLGHAPVAAVGAHDDLVVADGEHRAGRERVAAHRGDRRKARAEDRGEQPVHAVPKPASSSWWAPR
jgi:hypothetical protein